MKDTNQFQRTESILGAGSTQRLKECRVAVFGAGGVGGFVIESLARSGMGTIDIIDSDKVDITNLNRQIIATHDTVGMFKVDAFEERIRSICPETIVNKHKGFYLPKSSLTNITQRNANNDIKRIKANNKINGIESNDETSNNGSPEKKAAREKEATEGQEKTTHFAKPIPENVLTEDDIDFEKFDYIVDAIDTVAAKVDIICKADALGIPVISAMGCGNRLDPSLLKVTDIFSTQGDPLAKIMRKQLRQHGIKKLKVVCSDEEPLKPDCSGITKNTNEKGKNPPGSSPFVPAAAGLLICSIVVRDILITQP